MGAIETGGEVAKATVEGLKTSPALLALIVMQILTLGLITWNAHERNIQQSQLNELLLKMCQRVNQTGVRAGDMPCNIKPL